MKDIMRKHLWPAALVAVLAVVGMLAAFVVLTGPQRGTAEAQSICAGLSGATLQAFIQAGVCQAATTTPAPTTPGATTPATGGGDGSVCAGKTGDELAGLIAAGICMTPTATPTVTPVPTNTPLPTNTPEPTATPVPPTATPAPTATPIPPTPTPGPTRGVGSTIVKDSTSAGAGIKVTLTIGNLPMDMRSGSSVVLYLEDDFQVPDSIARNTVYFTVTNLEKAATGEGGRVYVTDPIEIDEDDYYSGDDDTSIRVYLPDFNTGDNFDGFQGPDMYQTLTMVITESGGIKNPTEAHDNNNNYVAGYKAGYDVLGVGAGVKGTPPAANNVENLIVEAKIGLNDEDMTRGKELIVTGSGFNNGTSAAAHVLHAVDPYPSWWDSINCAERNVIVQQSEGERDARGSGYCQNWADLDETQQAKIKDDVNLLGGGNVEAGGDADNGAAGGGPGPVAPGGTPGATPAPGGTPQVTAAEAAAAKATAEATFCRHIIRSGHRAGITTVDSDDKAAVAFEVTVPIFGPGPKNYICMVDGEGRTSSTDVETFDLEPSIRVSPTSASVGASISVFAQDFPDTGATFNELKIANQVVWRLDPPVRTVVPDSLPSIGSDGSATLTFDMPGSVAESALEGTVRIDAKWGTKNEDTKITLTGSALRLSATEIRANESLTIQGEGFGTSSGNEIDPVNITIDGVPLLIDDDSLEGGKVEVSSAGQFVATVYIWENDPDSDSNPALTSGTHTIRVRDEDGFYGSSTLVVKEPTMSILPAVLGPRDYLTVTGTDWPVDNADSSAPTGSVAVVVESRTYTVIPDATGRFTVEHRVSRDIAIPTTETVKATYKIGNTDFFVKTASFEVPAATIEVSPTEGQPGDEVTLTVTGMPVYAEVEEITIGGAKAGTAQDFRTDREGNVTADGLAIPGLDPGTYSVVMKVGSGSSQTVAIGSITVLAEGVAGAVAELPGALEVLGDNLEAVFYFDNVSKEWSFYDPREEFADLNTLSGMVAGEPYWILVGEAVDEVVLNDETRKLSCSNGDCWNLVVW